MSAQKPVGFSYMPNWACDPNDPRAWKRYPWSQVPEEPLQGFYIETQQCVMDTAIRQAVSAGIDFFSFDTYHDHTTRRFVGDHALKNFMASALGGMQFCVAMETENSEVPVTCLQDWLDIWDQVADISDHPRYLHLNGRPVVPMIKFTHVHNVITKATGLTHAQLMDAARKRAGKNLYFIAGVDAHPHWTWQAKVAGYDGHWFYNMFATLFGATPGPQPNTYAELAANYAAAWAWLVGNLQVDMWLSFTMGWDARLLQGGRLIGKGTPDELRMHFRAARDVMAAQAKVVGGIGYAWNEHSEGGAIEPTKALGREKLGVFKEVFKP